MPEPGPGAVTTTSGRVVSTNSFLPVAFVRNDQIDIVRIPLDGIVQLGGNAERVQAIAEHIGGGLAGVLGDDHGRDGKAVAAEQVNQAQHILVIGNTEVTTSLVFFRCGSR